MSKSLIYKLYLKQKLYSLKMQEGAYLVQHIKIFNHTVNDLQRIEFRIEDEDKAMILLCSLLLLYEHLVVVFTWEKLQSKQIKSLRHCWPTISRSRIRYAAGSQIESLYVKGNQVTGKRQEKDGFRKWNSRVKKFVQCYNCQQIGHIRNDCPNKK